jgi:CheY-like chemotaxis protein
MPTMGGIEASRQILQMQRDKGEELARIVVLTAFTNENTVLECENLGI